jgi:glycyl-tRNA synthetase
MEYFDQESGERFVPHVIEPSAGVDRIALALLCEAYRPEWISKKDSGDIQEADPSAKRAPDGYELRNLMKFAPCIAPVKAAVFPLLKNKPELVEKARKVYDGLRKRWNVFYDEGGAIGRRYRRQDEIGTPFGITIDFDTLDDDTVTLRERDTMEQVRLPIEELASRISTVVDV